MKITFRVLSIILSLALLAGCGPAATPAPTATNTPVPTATLTPTPSLREPDLPPMPVAADGTLVPLAVNPPVMNSAELLMGQINDDVVNESAASAVYALVRTETGPQNYNSSQEFIEKMNIYLGRRPDVDLIQVEGKGIVYSMLVKNKSQIYLVFNNNGDFGLVHK